jgi:hypothetical protein
LKSLHFGLGASCTAAAVFLVSCGAGGTVGFDVGCGTNRNPAAAAAAKSTLVERVGATGFLQLEADSFNQRTLRDQTLA